MNNPIVHILSLDGEVIACPAKHLGHLIEVTAVALNKNEGWISGWTAKTLLSIVPDSFMIR